MGFLERIVRETRARVAAPQYLEGLPNTGPSRRPSLRRAIQEDHGRGALLAEYKRRSPGAVAPNLPHRSPEEFVRALEPAEPTGYSCLAAEPEFRGSPADVAALVRATRRPVLFKDFVVEQTQLEAATRTGASAVLLIARLETAGLLTESLADLARGAKSRGLEVLLEFHEPAELRHTADVPADMYGVNVRDLDSLEFRPAVAAETLRAASGRHPLLGLSGVDGPEAARRLWELGADGILLGTALARTPDPTTFLGRLRAARAPGAV